MAVVSPGLVTGRPVSPTRRTPWLRRRAVNGSMSSTYQAIEWMWLPKRALNRPSGVPASAGSAAVSYTHLTLPTILRV